MKKYYKYEMHMHSFPCSHCGSASAEELVKSAAENGYAGVVFTNHFFKGNTGIPRDLPWAEFVAQYGKDYETAKKLGAELNVQVLFGVEEGLGLGKEVLIYGLLPQVFAAETHFNQMTLPQMSAFVHRHGGLIFSAHPFRNRSYVHFPDEPPQMQYLDGLEGYNAGNNREDDTKAVQFANQNHLVMISGGDVHSAAMFGKAGLAFDELVTDNKQLVAALKAGAFLPIVNGEVVTQITAENVNY